MDEKDKAFEAELTQALERQPVAAIPVDFAAKVRAALPPQRAAHAGRFAGRSLGRMVATVAAAGLVVALCLLAPHARPSFASIAFDMELLLLVELAGVGAWLSRSGRRG